MAERLNPANGPMNIETRRTIISIYLLFYIFKHKSFSIWFLNFYYFCFHFSYQKININWSSPAAGVLKCACVLCACALMREFCQCWQCCYDVGFIAEGPGEKEKRKLLQRSWIWFIFLYSPNNKLAGISLSPSCIDCLSSNSPLRAQYQDIYI